MFSAANRREARKNFSFFKVVVRSVSTWNLKGKLESPGAESK